MDAPFESSAEEVARLRDCLTDLASIMALPALSTGGEPGQIVSTLADALLGMLQLAFVCVRLNDSEGGPSIETMHIGDTLGGTARSDVSFASTRLGLHGELGIVVAGSWRLDFPADTERLLLDVAANQTTIGLQQARLLKQAGLRSEQKGIMDTIPGLVAMLTPAGEVDVVNHELVEYCGQGLEAMKQWGANGTVHANDLPRVGPVFTQAIASGTPYDFEARVRRFDGVYRWCQIRGLPHRDTSEHIARWYVLLTDIDDRKHADAELRRAYDSFADAQRLSKTGSFITDLVVDDHHWSDEAYRIFDFDPGTKLSVQKVGHHPP
jgi:PAS domain S-box-containing protein